jgi:hypothetical protein
MILTVQIIFGKDPGIFGDPDDQLIGANAALTDSHFGGLRLRAQAPAEGDKSCQQSQNILHTSILAERLNCKLAS